jgi:hypothetical protein
MLQALLWGFSKRHTGACLPSNERVADKAGCARSTVAEELKPSNGQACFRVAASDHSCPSPLSRNMAL